jgi:selenocysteine lyase/cysteine desulfurase
MNTAAGQNPFDVFSMGLGRGQRTHLGDFFSHITSPSAMFFPVAVICHRARKVGILTIIDGVHAPGQISLDLAFIDDLYWCL